MISTLSNSVQVIGQSDGGNLYRCVYDFKEIEFNRTISRVRLMSGRARPENIKRLQLTYSGKKIWDVRSDILARTPNRDNVKCNFFDFWIDYYHIDCVGDGYIDLGKVCPILTGNYCGHVIRHFKLTVDCNVQSQLNVEFRRLKIKERIKCVRHRQQLPRVKFYRPRHIGRLNIFENDSMMMQTHYLSLDCEYTILDMLVITDDIILPSDFLVRVNYITLLNFFKSDIYHVSDGSIRYPKVDCSKINSPKQVKPIKLRGNSIELEAWHNYNNYPNLTVDIIAIELIEG